LSEECRKREEESLVSLFSGENVEREEELVLIAEQL
jgi:hypothetical protein